MRYPSQDKTMKKSQSHARESVCAGACYDENGGQKSKYELSYL